MRQILTAKEMRDIEKNAIDNWNIPSLVLMERAAFSVAEKIKNKFPKTASVCIVCGGGNNGADGVAVARILLEEEYRPELVVLADPKKFSDEMKYQLDLWKKLGCSYEKTVEKRHYDCIVDAILGIGLSRNITKEGFLNAIETINSSGAYIYSVDIPTGINTDNGCIMGKAVKANETITFSYEKVGLCIFPGKEYAGKITVSKIGIPVSCINSDLTGHYTIKEHLPKRLFKTYPDGNKGSYGKVLVIAGNEEISGAAVLCAKAAMKSGAGMVKVLSSKKTIEVIKTTLPEAMTAVLDKTDAASEVIQDGIAWADCVIIGPGIGTDEEAYFKLYLVLDNFPESKKLVIDADAINLLASHNELKRMTEMVNDAIYTPHMMELARLTDVDIQELKNDLDTVMGNYAADKKGIYVCKDSVTRVYAFQKAVYINRLGNCGMATAGSGDVLAGIIGAMVAKRGTDIYEETILGVHLHSLAGDIAAQKYGKNGLMAGDMIDCLSDIWKMAED